MAIKKEEAIVSIKEFEPQIWTCVNCYCGLCVEGCPVFKETKKEVGSARGMALVAHAYLNGELDLSDIEDSLAYACTGCGWCEWTCSLNTPLFIQRTGTRRTRVSGGTLAEIFRSMRAEQGKIPKAVSDALSNLMKSGNPYGMSKKSKDKWVAGLDLGDKLTDTILYVGATIPFEERATQMAEALVDVLKAAQIDISMLGSAEMDSGAFAMMMGEEGLFEEMTELNEKTIKERGVKQIICVSPHDYDAFKAYYPALEGLDIKHYTQVFAELLEQGKLKLSKSVNKKIVYHDPCYLGRKNDIYDEPRNVLKSIAGVELVEMKKAKANAYCCGGGGTGLVHEVPNIRMNQTRVDHAKEQNADCIAVACPICLQMLDDGVKSRNYKIEVKDIAQLIKEAL
jgi:Fe-S oxidoreductase